MQSATGCSRNCRTRREVLEEEGEEDEYVLLDLESISNHIGIQPNTPCVLSGLDMANPILLIDNKLKLMGEYEETIGTCVVFSENEGVLSFTKMQQGSLMLSKPCRLSKSIQWRSFIRFLNSDHIWNPVKKPSQY
ncbi:hypothetical protein ACS0TY_016947 [Phlomoides rotata]